jgi:hypothetical protein
MKTFNEPLLSDGTGKQKDDMCKKMSPDHRTWEPETFWEYVWLGSLMSTSKFVLGCHA